MTSADEHFKQLLATAQSDPNIVGFFVGGSRGKGFVTPYSDYDVYLVVRDEVASEYRKRYEKRSLEGLDIAVHGHRAFAELASYGGPDDWMRYSFAHLTVLVDKAGDIQALVDAKGRLPEEARIPLVRGALDAYVNSVYRGVKALRNGNELGARLHASASLGSLICVLFALEGRHAPYLDYLERELRAYPLERCPLGAGELLARLGAVATTGELAAQQELVDLVEGLCVAAGCGDVLEAWGPDYPWLKSYRPEQG